MALSSMTGFGAAAGSNNEVDWRWELRTLNARGLDIRIRVPAGYEELDRRARAKLAERLARGSCHISLQIKRHEATAEPRINEPVMRRILEISRRLQNEDGVGPAHADGILALRGVLEFVEPEVDADARDALLAALGNGLDDALEALADDRRSEGEKLGRFLSGQVDDIARLGGEIGKLPARSPEVVAQKLKSQIDKVLGDRSELSDERLHLEAALLATKADIREELDRLASHIEAAYSLLASGEPVGRRLDFLAQEFNREANTICSKSGDIDTTRLGLDLKAVIDQFKEQVQNVE